MKGLKAISLMVLLALVGCDGQKKTDFTSAQSNLGRRDTKTVILRSIRAMGGMDRLTTRIYRANATVTQSGPFDAPMVWQVRMEIDPFGRSIVASAPAGDGQWKATIQGGNIKFETLGLYRPTGQQKKAICGMLTAVLHRVAGPLNFYIADEKAGGLSKALVDGERVSRVGVTGGGADIRAYYFDPRTYLPRFATASADVPNKPGTTTIYQWQRLRGGIMFPRSISVVHIGQNSLIGPEEVLGVDFDNVESVEADR
jgi:hypothetical protein